ncbi:MAG: hypothetical protein NC483_04215 [Ruminococcus sp.]|nr:hypothetical protein [Ruminococcus sp.]
MKEKEKRYGLLKGVLALIVIAILLSWLVPNGEFSSGGFSTDGTLYRIGIYHLGALIFYGLSYSIDQIAVLLTIGALYGVLSKTSAYDRLVTGIANKFKHKGVAVVLFSVLIAVLTSLLTETLAVVIFIPFIISILNKLKLDKMTIMMTSFGSVLVGMLGATYGTSGLPYLFGQYMLPSGSTYNEAVNASVLIRFGILAVGLILFNFFTLTHMKKQEKNSESVEIFNVEVAEDNKKKSSIIPIVVVGILLFVLVVLGLVDWQNNFNITVFETLHESISSIKIGSDFYIFKDLLGSQLKAFGSWDLFAINAVMLIFTIVLGLCYRFKFDEFIDAVVSGIKKMLKPCLCVIGAITLMIVVYMSPYVATVMNKILSITDGFNLGTMMLASLVANIFHTDLSFTGMIAGQYLMTEYVDYINPIHIIFISLYGFLQFFIPTSVVMGIGLTSLKVKYRDWLKNIWRFLVGMFICLLIIFILISVL